MHTKTWSASVLCNLRVILGEFQKISGDFVIYIQLLQAAIEYPKALANYIDLQHMTYSVPQEEKE